LKIGKHEVGKGKPVFIVAEAGMNHNGDFQIAKKMIKAATNFGADAIKFQTIFPDELYASKDNNQLYNLINKWSFNKKQHKELKKYAEKNKIEFFSAPVGNRSANLLFEIGCKCFKIASGELTNLELIKNIAKMKRPMIVSTGLSTPQEITSAVKIIRKQKCPFVLLHCNASYPSPLNDVNLRNIEYLNEVYGVPIGFSDHTMGNEACLAAVSLGACIIEKHFTLDKKMKGPDQKLSADVSDFKELVTKIRIVEKTFGTLRKGPTPSEKKFVTLLRKSLVANKDITKNTKIKKSMLTSLRPGIGISLAKIDKLVGMRIKKNIKKGTILKWKMF